MQRTFVVSADYVDITVMTMTYHSSILLLVACTLPGILAQVCNCPLQPISTTTAPAASCPTDGTLSITITYIAGQCRNFRITTTTTTRTIGSDGQPVCNCPTAPATTTETAPLDCTGVSATTTVSIPSIECPWGSTATQTVTRYGTGNGTLYPTSASPSSNAATPTGTSPPTPSCSLSELPDDFYLIGSLSGYQAFDGSCNKTHGCPYVADAAVFHINDLEPEALSGVPQLSLYAKHPYTGEGVELGAYVSIDGGNIQYFAPEDEPDADDWLVVTASFSEFLCEMGLMAYGLHDLSTPEDCNGLLSLGFGFLDEECPETRLTVEPA